MQIILHLRYQNRKQLMCCCCCYCYYFVTIWRSICCFMMLPEVLEEDDEFLQVSSARRLVNISGTVRPIDLTFAQVKDMGLLDLKKHSQLPDAPGSLGGGGFPPSVFCQEINEYLSNCKSDRLEIFTYERYGCSCFNGRVYISTTTTMVAQIGTKLISQEPRKNKV
jgi:hypothetical protein